MAVCVPLSLSLCLSVSACVCAISAWSGNMKRLSGLPPVTIAITPTRNHCPWTTSSRAAVAAAVAAIGALSGRFKVLRRQMMLTPPGSHACRLQRLMTIYQSSSATDIIKRQQPFHRMMNCRLLRYDTLGIV